MWLMLALDPMGADLLRIVIVNFDLKVIEAPVLGAFEEVGKAWKQENHLKTSKYLSWQRDGSVANLINDHD